MNTMNTKEAIEFLRLTRLESGLISEKKVYDEIADLLKRGEKYEQMWGEFTEDLRRDIDTEKFSGHTIEHILGWYKQKYFPEPIKEEVIIRKLEGVIGEIEKFIKEIEEDIKDWREVAKSGENPKLPGEDFGKGWKLAINRVCNSMEKIVDKFK